LPTLNIDDNQLNIKFKLNRIIVKVKEYYKNKETIKTLEDKEKKIFEEIKIIENKKMRIEAIIKKEDSLIEKEEQHIKELLKEEKMLIKKGG